MLREEGEDITVIDKSSGLIKVKARDIENKSWIGRIGKTLGSTFKYQYHITCRDSWVKLNVPFGVRSKDASFLRSYAEEDFPDGSNMMRHIFFRELDKQLTKIAKEFPSE
jgi:hypothetical protein